jgi:SAM-dependent methyltransferase/uncharacterized protein YbaR (Trm112 family)
VRLRHFEELSPVCPRCRAAGRDESPLLLANIERGTGEELHEGILHCTHAMCRQEFPVIDGIPILVPDVGRYLSENLWHLTARGDLSHSIETLLGDAAGQTSAYDSIRSHTSSYAYDHWGEFDPEETATRTKPGSVARCLSAGLDLLAGEHMAGPALDVGCSVGRSSFVLAGRVPGLVLGGDLNFSMLRVARKALTEGTVRYARRRIGLVYDRRCFDVPNDCAERLDFWVMDAMVLPFAQGRFGTVTSLNMLDCVPDPRAVLVGIGHVLAPDGAGVLATPYDWSVNATQPQGWIGGHSQRGIGRGAGEPLLRGLLSPGGGTGLRMVGEIEDFPWQVRLHDRSAVSYSTHVIGVRTEAKGPV